jgi:dTDP-glucose 4,6-dehydratase
MTAAAAGVDFESFVTIAPGRATEDIRYWLDSSKIHDELGWRPNISLETGVAEMVEWARANLDALKLQTQQFSLRS